MLSYNNHDIGELSLSVPIFRDKLRLFLGENGLRMEEFDSYYVVESSGGEILAGAGIKGDVIKCVAVKESMREEGLLLPLLSHLVSSAASKGLTNLKVFTKPENRKVFESLGFHLLTSAPKAILMENGRGLERYCQYLRSFRREGRCGVVIMNANPFTLGHRYLLEQAAGLVDTLYVIPVLEDTPGGFPYAERLAMIRRGVETPGQAGGDETVIAGSDEVVIAGSDRQSPVIVLEGSSYQISAATFPTYFLKDLSEAAETQMRLDIDLFEKHIAPALDASVRFVGSEPTDALTARYNQLMQERLNVVEIPRLRCPVAAGHDAVIPGLTGNPISASEIRRFISEGSFAKASALVPESTRPYIMAALAERALRIELDTPHKPGLVCPDSSGAHSDMDYSTMLRGIAAIRPFFPQMAKAASADELRILGIEAEKAMLEATGGVNTHRGAIFCLGLALAALGREMELADNERDIQNRLGEIAQAIFDKQLKHSDLHFTPTSLAGARMMAAEGYRPLFEHWLPFFRQSGPQKTLLKIMSTLDDTCIVKRVGEQRAEEVKKEAGELLHSFNEERLEDMCRRYAAEGISPGGAADMLALTIFIDSIQK